MKSKITKTTLEAIVVVLLVSGMAFARRHSDSRGKSAGVDIEWSAMIPNGPSLQQGHYKVTLDTQSASPELEFYQDGKLVGQAPVTVVPESTKIEQTEVYYDNKGSRTITEFDLSGWREKLVFKAPSSMANTSAGTSTGN
jgi:hypothetical protein